MAIYNNTAMTNAPISKGNFSQVKKNEQSPITEISPVIEKTTRSDFSLVLSKQQQDSLHDTVGYDQPSARDRGALDAYHQVAVQEKREQVMDSMSFHFVV